MRRSTALLPAAALLLAGCGPASRLNLDLRSVSITVPRIVTPAVEIVPPATVPLPAPFPTLPRLATLLPPPAAPAPAPPPLAIPPSVRATSCPKAGTFDAPQVPADPLVKHPPAADTYTQSSFGSFSGAGSGSLDGSVRVVVTALPPSTTTAGQPIETWSVARTAASGSSVEVYDLVEASPSASAIAPGIYLVGLAWQDKARGNLSFQPVGNGLQILPNPVQAAQNATQYVGTATDPNTLTTLTLTRNVTGKKRVDACGKLIDTYTVAMTGTLASPGVQRDVTWTQQIATGYGGADAEDTLSLTSVTAGFTWTRTLRNTTLPKAAS